MTKVDQRSDDFDRRAEDERHQRVRSGVAVALVLVEVAGPIIVLLLVLLSALVCVFG
jgi:hypothetical protein